MRMPGTKTVIKPAPFDDGAQASAEAGIQAGDVGDTIPADGDGAQTAMPPPDLAKAMAPAPPRGPFLPLLLASTALLGWMGFQTWQLFTDRQALLAAHANQQQTVENAGKLRGSLDVLAADTQRLADAGNASARLLVEELKKRGVTINAAAAGAAPK